MAMKAITRRFKPLEILTQENIEQIHRATLDVLWETGLRMEHKRALKILEQNGCKVDHEQSRVRFPPGLVEESLRKCPSMFHVKARDSKHDLVLGGNSTYFAPFPGMDTVDLDTWERRTATRKEFYDGVKVEDSLDTIGLFMQYTPYFAFESVPPVMSMPECCAAKIRNSTRFQGEGYAHGCERFTIQMAQAVGAEIFIPCLPAPPLTYYEDAIEAGLRGAEAGMPVKVGDGQVFGATAPATLAGATVTNNAELIAPIVLLQLVKPGTRIIASHFTFPTNMSTGAPVFGGIGIALQAVAFNQIWRMYGLPIANLDAGPANSKKIDFQLGYEKSMAALLLALSGANFIGFHGAVMGELTHHPVQAVLDHDVAGRIRRLLEGIEVNDETLATELINEVGPVPGHYLNTAHTRKWWKIEQFIPKAADRLTYPEWMKAGKKSALDYAKERTEEILATHNPIPLTPGQENDIERILKEAREYYKKQDLISDEEWAVYMNSLRSPNYPFA